MAEAKSISHGVVDLRDLSTGTANNNKYRMETFALAELREYPGVAHSKLRSAAWSNSQGARKFQFVKMANGNGAVVRTK